MTGVGLERGGEYRGDERDEFEGVVFDDECWEPGVCLRWGGVG